MKAPLSWLKDYVDIDCSPEELKDKLFSCGFEVEDMEYTYSHIDKIVTCKITKIEKHPNADKLSVCQIDAGEYGNLQIITAATNVFEGAIVPVALDGATLYNKERIFNGKLRGLPSFGMFCSGEELGITDCWYKGASTNGILIFTEDYPLGASVKEILELEDVMFDINVTANRPDCQSIFGLAREVAAVLNKKVKMPNLSYKTSNISTKDKIKVSDIATDLCPRYMARYVSDIKIEESPLWLKRKLFKMGIRSISNIVDITNFVLLELGQPMHAFDLSELDNNEIVIRRANESEKIITLDEKEFTLSGENLVIADKNKPVALAGIMGGLNSGIKETTKEVVFESAKFKRDNIRKTSKFFGQRTDASSRYEKGVDAYTVKIAMDRALNLIDTLNCGVISSDGYDLCYEDLTEKQIVSTYSKINEVLGIDVPKEVVNDILTRLNFEVNENGDEIIVKVPLYREDMEDYPDVAEEIIREYGYDHITPTLLKTSKITNGGRTIEQENIENFKNLLIGFGFNEIITYSFVSEKEYDIFGLDKDSEEHKFIKILNPIGEDLAVMRTSLLPSIVRTVANNINRKNSSGKLFELAKIYNAKALPLEELAIETNMLSIATFGETEDFFTIKGVIEGILSAYCNGVSVQFTKCTNACMHPTRSAFVIVDGENIGYFGQVSPVVLSKIDIDKPVFAGEINFDKLKNHFNSKIIFKAVSKFPIVERDLAIIVDKSVSWGEIQETVTKSAGKYLQSIKLFDIYTGDQVAEGKKSMAFNLTFVSNEKTLTVEEIDHAIKKILASLENNLHAELR